MTSLLVNPTIEKKLKALRTRMAKLQLDAIIVLSTDEHLNEYVPEANKRREWVSGFSGSAGDVLVTRKQAWLFVDSRYYQQADLEVNHESFKVSKVGLEGHCTLVAKISKLAAKKIRFCLGYAPFTVPLSRYLELTKAVRTLKMVALPKNLVDELWHKSRPTAINSEVVSIATVAGQTIASKLKALRKELKKNTVTVLSITKLDHIAWLFNLRGNDIQYNPVFTAYAIITPDRAFLFTDATRINKTAQRALHDIVQIQPYDAYQALLKKLTMHQITLIDSKNTTTGTYRIIKCASTKKRDMFFCDDPIQSLKAIKNTLEINGMEYAGVLASRAKVRAFKWLDEQLHQANTVTEESFRQVLEGYYNQDQAFAGLSFETIVGTGANSAIVHYDGKANPGTELRQGHFFLVDSGAHYFDKNGCGTTDATRTLIIGTPTAEQKQLYTLVLQAHVDCARQKFPKGSNGVQLDGITRSILWNATPSINFGHGCGHGVGCFLNVHEGPPGIHQRANTPLLPGMITSIEPGYYRHNWGGIRIESMFIINDMGQTTEPDKTPVYGFAPLTYIPFDKRLINKRMLNNDQLMWIQSYHVKVVEKLTPLLTSSEAKWLGKICQL